MAAEGPGQVFEELLQEWRAHESKIIHEWSSDFDEDMAEADRKMADWRERYRKAEERGAA